MLFELKNETNDEMLDIMSPHARGSGNVDKQTKRQPRELIDNNNNGGKNTIVRKRNNNRNEDEDIYAEKKGDAKHNKAKNNKKEQ